jgi:competence protein ComGC
MAIVEFVFVISVGVLLVLGALNSARSSQQQKQLEEAFYRLLEAQNGQISLIQLAAGARVDAEVAKQYLERQAKAFAATLEVDADGDTFYRFPKLQLPPQR